MVGSTEVTGSARVLRGEASHGAQPSSRWLMMPEALRREQPAAAASRANGRVLGLPCREKDGEGSPGPCPLGQEGSVCGSLCSAEDEA